MTRRRFIKIVLVAALLLLGALVELPSSAAWPVLGQPGAGMASEAPTETFLLPGR